MPREFVIGNGTMQINFDRDLNMRDMYFPGVGLNNHIMAHRNRLGVWVDGHFSWLESNNWLKKNSYIKDSLVTDIKVFNEKLKIELRINDAVDVSKNIFYKKISIVNQEKRSREVRIFMTFDFSLNENSVADTAFYDPTRNCLCHYKKNTYLLINGQIAGQGIYQYSIGKKRIQGAEGTWRDAEDGVLEQNPVSHGSIDSAVSFRTSLEGNGEALLFSWIAAGKSIGEVWELDAYVKEKGIDRCYREIEVFWQSWVHRHEQNFFDLPEQVVDLYHRSLLIIRTQIDNGGAILASTDADVLQHYPDHYSYVWPRDGALVAFALDKAGYPELSLKFFEFCSKIISEGGYFLHRYNADGTLGSSWHPWWKDGEVQLPIQEDETALVIFALGQHCKIHGDIELVHPLYDMLVKRASDFLVSYRDSKTGLPLPSYDLWEERRGIFTFTTSAICGALQEAAYLAGLMGDAESYAKYLKASQEVREAMLKYLYCPEVGRFLRGIYPSKSGDLERDFTLDSSMYGLFEFSAFPATDERVSGTMEAIINGLSVKSEIGGVARYTNDYYSRKSEDIENVPGNPWFICTLWQAEWYAEIARNLDELKRARNILEWAVKYIRPTGIMSEQVHPYTGEDVSVSPLTWSHSTFVLAVQKYLNKYRKLEEKQILEQRKKNIGQYNVTKV